MQTATINVKVDTTQAQKSVNDLNQTIGQTNNTTASLKLQLRQITQELQGLEPGSARFTELTQKAGQLRDTIADTNAVINATAGNVTENLGKGLTSVASIGVAAFQSVTAAQTLMGVESEEITKTIAKLTALMNLSQAIETFGGLGDKITQIKASFMGLAQTLGIVTVAQQATAVAATEAAVAEGAEAIAADAAAVSTGAFAVTLNALPLVAIVTALGLLIAGLVTYASSSSNAAKEEEKRKKLLQEQKKLMEQNAKATKEHGEYIFKETGAFVSLVLQLKGSNQGSKERLLLLGQINKQYGTTLQNLSNENLFQQQLNIAIDDYIKLAEAKYKMSVNEDKIKKIIVERVKLEEGLQKMQNVGLEQTFENRQKMDALIKQYGGDALALTYKFQNLGENLKGLTKTTFTLGDEVNSLSSKYKINNNVVNTNTKDIKTNTDAVEESIDARLKYKETLKGIIDEEKAVSEEEQAILKERQKADNLIKLQADAIDEVEKNRAKGIYKTAEAYKTALGGIKSDSEIYLKDQLEVIKKEGEARVRASNVTIGGGGETPAAKKARLAKEKALKSEMELVKKNFDQEIKDAAYFETARDTKIAEIRNTYAQRKIEDEKLVELEIQKIQLDSLQQQELNLATTEEQKTAIRKSFADRIRTNEEQIIKLQAQIQLRDTKLTEDQRTKIIEEAENKILKLKETTLEKTTDKTRTELQTLSELNTQFQKDWEENWMDTLTKLVGKIAEISAQITGLFSQAFQQAADNQLGTLEQLTANEQEQLSASLLNREITEKEYDEKKKLLENSAAERKKQIEIKEFRRQKALNIVNAVMATAVGITKALPNPILMALAAVLGVAQVAIIASQQFRAAQGGVVPQNGQSGNVDSVPSLLAPGEVVVNSQSAQMFPQLLSDINQAGGGKRLVPDVAFTNPYSQGNVFQPQQQVVQAYVVESQITNSQRRISRMERAASF